MTKELKNIAKKKSKVWNTYLGVKSFSNWTFYKKTHNKQKINFEYKLVDNMRDNLKSFWKYVRLTQKTKENVADLRTCKKGIHAMTSVSKANVLNSFFASIFTEENMNNIPNPEICYVQSELTDLSITPEIVKQKLAKLKENRACGPDLIHQKILIELQAELVLPLVGIFNQSLQDGRLPLVWKQANVCPIFKKGERADPANYRPVSLTSCICKIIESIIRDAIYDHLQVNNILRNEQFGFRSGRSCNLQLLETP